MHPLLRAAQKAATTAAQKAVEVAKADGKLVLYNFTGFN